MARIILAVWALALALGVSTALPQPTASARPGAAQSPSTVTPRASLAASRAR
jgi:hypothetical protein